MLKINCFLYAVRVQDCKQREAYLSMWESRKQPYLPLIKSTKTQYKEGGRRIRPARYTCRAINTTYSANPSVLEIIELAITIRKIPRRTDWLIGHWNHISGGMTMIIKKNISAMSFCEVCVCVWGGSFQESSASSRSRSDHLPSGSGGGCNSLCFRWIGAHLNRERTWPLPLCFPPVPSMFV